MGKYHSLEVWSYENGGKDLEKEYLKRLEYPSAFKTNLEINAFQKDGVRLKDVYPLFLVVTSEHLNKVEEIRKNSEKITSLVAEIPTSIVSNFLAKILVNELQGTNDIEGVKSTRKELLQAYEDIEREKQKRSGAKFFHFVDVYYTNLLQNKKKPLESLKDVRELYDYLLAETMTENERVDGEYFRNKPVYIRDSLNVIHIPKEKESDIIKDMNELLKFYNDDEMPKLYKILVFHYYFEYIHPFYDGNGRLGRFLLCRDLVDETDLCTALSLSYQISNNREKYYNAFKRVPTPKNKGEITFFVKTMLEIIKASQVNFLIDLNDSLSRYKEKLESIRDYQGVDHDVLDLYIQSDLFSFENLKDSEIKENLKERYSLKSIKESINKLTEQGKLKVVKRRPYIRELTEL